LTSISILRRKKPLRDGLHPIILKVIKDREIQIVSLGFSCPENEWNPEKKEFRKNHPNYIQRNALLSKLKSRALSIIDDFRNEDIDFSLSQFEERFRGDHKRNNMSIYDFFEYKINMLNESGRTGSARAYKDASLAFFKFYFDKNLMFHDLSASLLEKFEAHLRGRGNTDGGIAVRMRHLRALYNDAISKDVASRSHYPFDTYKISKLKGKGLKRALTRSEIGSIMNFDVLGSPSLVNAKNYFLFSYFTRGMSYVDMMRLTWDHIQGDNIVYIRSKTKGRFTVKILPPVRDILNYYKLHYKQTNYVFPILLREGMTPMQIENRKSKTLKKFNKDLKALAILVGIDKTLTSYVARHSFATNLKELGVSTDIISESMGHQNINITNAYLKEFENDVIDEANEKLIHF
jgi:integrase/recombinase XerD